MKKVFKILLIIVSIVILAFAILIGYFMLNRDKIYNSVKTSLQEQTQGIVEYDKAKISLFANFPNFSVELKNVLFADSLYSVHHVPLIKAKSIFLEVNLWKLLSLNVDVTKVKIQEASVRIFKTCDGYSNSYVLNNLFKKKEKPLVEEVKAKSNAEFHIEKVSLDNVLVNISDSIKDKSFGFTFKDVACKLDRTPEEMKVLLDGDIFMEGLTFKRRKGTFLKNQNLYLKVNLRVGDTASLIQILPSVLKIGNAPFALDGHINTKGDGDLKLHLINKALTLAATKNILTNHIYSKLAKYAFLGALEADVIIQTPLKNGPGDPYITVYANGKNVPLSIAGNEIDSASFNGTFKNYITYADSLSEPCDENSTIVFKNLTAVANGIKLNGDVKVSNLSETILEVMVKGDGELTRLQNLVNENSLVMKKGSLHLDIDLKGNVSHLVDTINNKMNGTLNGGVVIKDGALYNVPKKLLLSNINSNIEIKNNIAHIKQFHVNAPGSDLNLTADIEKLLIFMISDKSTLVIKCNLTSNNLNFEPLLASSQTVAVAATPAKKKKKLEQSISNAVDHFLKNSEIVASFVVKHAYFRKFNAYNGTGQLQIGNGKASINNFSFEHAHGNIKCSSSIVKQANGYGVSFKTDVKNINMPELLAAFENFNQKSLTQNNIKGIVNLNVDATCMVNNDFKITPNSMHGNLKLKIDNGELNNFAPLVSLSKFIFKNRGLDSIQFSTINGSADLKGDEIYFHKMIVLSTALSLAIDGIYSFGDNTDLSIQVPLKNLKSNSPEYFTSIEKFESYNGANVYIRGKTKDGKLSFSYDPLKKMRKDKTKKK